MRHFGRTLELICKSVYIAELWSGCSSAFFQTLFHLGERGEKKEIVADILRRMVCVFGHGFLCL